MRVQAPSERLLAEGIRPNALFETALEVPNLGSAAEELLNIPEFRRVMLLPEATDIGVGVARAESGELFVTLTYAQLPPVIDPGVERARIIAKIAALKVDKPRVVDAEMTEVAQRYVEVLASDASEQARRRALQAGRFGLQTLFHKVSHGAASVVEVGDLDVTELVTDRESNTFGVGVAQAARYGAQAGVVWVVVVTGRRSSL